MNDANTPVTPAPAPSPPRSALAAVLDLLASFRFAVIIVALLALVCIVGTLLPQGTEEVEGFVGKHPSAAGWMERLASLGLTNVFASRWFAVLLCIFSASLLTCTARRGAAIGRTRGAARIRILGSFLTHISILLVLVGGVIRSRWGESGMLSLPEGGSPASQFQSRRGDTPTALPFAIKLLKFEIELHATPEAPAAAGIGTLAVLWQEKGIERTFPVELNKDLIVGPAAAPPEDGCVVRVTRYLPDFVVGKDGKGPMSRSDEPNNPAVQVEVTAGGNRTTEWVFARFPDFNGHGSGKQPLRFRLVPAGQQGPSRGPVKAYKSSVQILEGDAVMLERVIQVNAPLSYKGYTFYQTSYGRNQTGWVSTLQVVRDPGVPLVFLAFALMMVGLTMVFCVAPWMTGDGQRKPGAKP